tara:strand:- start:5515 stop:6426 length:912 start_codon:yes stop_codon:yes gene_type:complete
VKQFRGNTLSKTTFATNMSKFIADIRPVLDHTSCEQVQWLGKSVWGGTGEAVAPNPLLITLTKNGGILLAAYLPDGPDELDGMVGFVFGFPAHERDSYGQTVAKHCSHQLAVLPNFRRKGIGLQLKLAQRDAVLAQGMTEKITWTFDPLQRVNAIFNLESLGVISQTYIKNAYGDLDDDLNIGLTTDRLQVDWNLTSPRVLRAIARQNQDTLSHEHLYILSEPKTDKDCNVYIPTNEKYGALAVPLPNKIDNRAKSEQANLSLWRQFLESALTSAFDIGYTLSGCHALPNMGHHYILITDPKT